VIVRFGGAVAEPGAGASGAELAAALAQLGRIHVLAGHGDGALEPLERALTIAGRLQLPEVFVEALTSKALVLVVHGRLDEARILLEAAVARAYAEEINPSALAAGTNNPAALPPPHPHVYRLDHLPLPTGAVGRSGHGHAGGPE
jgi:hypothetical protein